MASILALGDCAVMAGGAGAGCHVAVISISVITAVVFFSVFFAIAFVIQALNAGSATNAAIVPG